MRNISLILVMSAAILMSACAVGPNYRAPQTPTDAAAPGCPVTCVFSFRLKPCTSPENDHRPVANDDQPAH